MARQRRRRAARREGHAREQRPTGDPGLITPLRLVLVVAVVGVVVALVLITGLAGSGDGDQAPGAAVGNHWHAAISFEVCGESFNPPALAGGIHSHGDGQIHIHPTDASEAGDNATLSRFFASVGAEVVPGTIQLPGQVRHADGGACPDGKAGRLRVTVNGKERADFLGYRAQDGDEVEVRFD